MGRPPEYEQQAFLPAAQRRRREHLRRDGGGEVVRTLSELDAKGDDVQSRRALPPRPVASPDYQLSLQAFSLAFLGDALYVATVGHGVLRSYDLGKTWSRAFRGLPFLATQRLGFDSTGTIYVTTFGGGAWLLFSPSW